MERIPKFLDRKDLDEWLNFNEMKNRFFLMINGKIYSAIFRNISSIYSYFIILSGNKRDTRGGYIFDNPGGAMNSKH